LSRICIYGAASDRIQQVYIDEVYKLGKKLGEAKHTLVFGGGRSGLMGAAARGFYDAKAKIVSIVPHFMHSVEPIFEESTEFVHTDTMSERKEKMEDSSDGFIIVPGGVGTLDEFYQILTLKELNQQGNKPIIVFNINGFYNKLQEMMEFLDQEGFFRPEIMKLYTVCNTVDEVVNELEKQLEQA